jgi:hypothetical protein
MAEIKNKKNFNPIKNHYLNLLQKIYKHFLSTMIYSSIYIKVH